MHWLRDVAYCAACILRALNPQRLDKHFVLVTSELKSDLTVLFFVYFA